MFVYGIIFHFPYISIIVHIQFNLNKFRVKFTIIFIYVFKSFYAFKLIIEFMIILYLILDCALYEWLFTLKIEFELICNFKIDLNKKQENKYHVTNNFDAMYGIYCQNKSLVVKQLFLVFDVSWVIK